ncbi:Endonuclease/exonuclease/phosphatase [Protomyces lactucae-debilis]|uniref:DNA-(apurinic or apyrimidinic site) endonuclease n=1 Tax=Protomyces lactucae-debilis TaxID=2754530 RepID=A0A1Y2F6W2_PROLT|nr:Endonuclease/exonuclease/phosphatase [Protomyces lactucae-debilis]ORY78665.1 Endonuclease/exonuclease/phosphatase [Protomyces lactucae-debilis]
MNKRKRTASISPPPMKTQKVLDSYTSPLRTNALFEAGQAKLNHVSNTSSSASAGASNTLKRTIKLISWNCDGLNKYLSPDNTTLDKFITRRGSPTRNTAKTSFLTQFLAQHSPDVLCLQEVHVSSSKRASLLRRLKSDAPNYEATCCLPASNKHAGVVTLCIKSLAVKHTMEVDWDHEGRVLIHELDGLTLFNVYCLNSSDHPWRDATGTIKGTRAERKRQFQRLLAQEMLLQSAEQPVVALGDFNISRFALDATPGTLRTQETHVKNRREFNALFGKFVDLIREAHPSARKYTWHSRTGTSEARVDLILASSDVQRTVCDTMESVGRGQSDHSPLFAAILIPSQQISGQLFDQC